MRPERIVKSSRGIANVPNDTINYLEPNIGNFNETYRVNPNGGGISLKIATVPDDPPLTTLTTTITSVGPVVTSQDTASDIVITDPVTTSMVTISSETILRASETTDAADQHSLTTLRTVIAVTTLD